ncbi:formimidoylglutamase [Haloferacaceae archaeon DSL9]
MSFVPPVDFAGWTARSSDPNDDQFGAAIREIVLDDADRFDAVLVGEPFDGAVIGRRGARCAPTYIREALAGLKTHHFETGPVGGVGDIGDVARLAALDESDAEAVAETHAAVEAVARDVHARDALPVFLGGDNSLTVPNVGPLLECGSVGVLNFDAHLDVREVRGDATSGTPYRQLLEAGLDRYVCLGARHFETSTAYHEVVRDHDGRVITADAVGGDPAGALARALEALDDVDTLYVSVDLDVLDATAAPGVSAPTPGGLTARELFGLLREVGADDRLAGFEVVECAPPLDRDGRTVAAAARAVAHLLSGYGAKEGHE